MDLNISPSFIIGVIIIFVILFNVGIILSFLRNKNRATESAFGKLIKGTKNNFHKDKENIDELSKLLSDLKDSEKD